MGNDIAYTPVSMIVTTVCYQNGQFTNHLCLRNLIRDTQYRHTERSVAAKHTPLENQDESERERHRDIERKRGRELIRESVRCTVCCF